MVAHHHRRGFGFAARIQRLRLRWRRHVGVKVRPARVQLVAGDRFGEAVSRRYVLQLGVVFAHQQHWLVAQRVGCGQAAHWRVCEAHVCCGQWDRQTQQLRHLLRFRGLRRPPTIGHQAKGHTMVLQQLDGLHEMNLGLTYGEQLA